MLRINVELQTQQTAIFGALACSLHIFRNFTLHHIERTGFGKELIQNVHVMHFAVRNAHKRGDIAVQIQQCMHLHRRLCSRNLAQETSERQRSMVVESKAFRLWSLA